MAIEIEVRGFTGPYASLNSGPIDHGVGMAELVNRAITVGGVVRGSRRERSDRRSAIASTVLSTVRASGPPIPGSSLIVTDLYDNTETSEKTGISFRLGMALAAVVAGRIVGIKVLQHVRARGVGSGRRADLVGLDAHLNRHVVEAKCRTYGVTSTLRKEAKDQATTTANAYMMAGNLITTASASLADLSMGRIRVLLTDPPASDDVLDRDFDEGAFLREYYSPVSDLLELRRPERSGFDQVDEAATGAWLPGSPVWLGLSTPMFELVLRSGSSNFPDDLMGFEPAVLDDDWLVSGTPDGHFVVLGPSALRLATA